MRSVNRGGTKTDLNFDADISRERPVPNLTLQSAHAMRVPHIFLCERANELWCATVYIAIGGEGESRARRAGASIPRSFGERSRRMRRSRASEASTGTLLGRFWRRLESVSLRKRVVPEPSLPGSWLECKSTFSNSVWFGWTERLHRRSLRVRRSF